MAALVTVTGRFELPDDEPGGPGALVWTLVPGDIPDLSEPSTVLAGPVRVQLDETGHFEIQLRATDDPELTAHVTGSLVYRVHRTIRGGITSSWSLLVPAPGPWDWTALSPAPPDSDVVVQPVPGPAGPQGDQGDVGPVGPLGPQGPEGEWVQLTQAAYDALAPPDPAVLYVIVG